MNKKILLLSFGISILLWFYVLNSKTYTMQKDIPLVFEKPQGMSIAKLSDEKINVKIKGTKFFLKQMDKYDPYLFLDLFQLKGRRVNFAIKKNTISIPFGTELMEYSPQNIDISLSPTRKKLIPVESKLIGELKQGLTLEKVEYRPKKVEVLGAWENLKKLKKLQTNPIDLDKVVSSKTKIKRKISLNDPRYEFDEGIEIEVIIMVRPEKRAQRLKNMALSIPQNMKALEGNPSLTLDVLVPDNYLLKQDQINMKLITPKGEKGALNAKVEVELPKGVELLRIYPEYIKVFVPQL